CSGDPCTYETTDNTYSIEKFWVNATDNAGNSVVVGQEDEDGDGDTDDEDPSMEQTDPTTASVETDGGSFAVKKWVGDECSTDRACLLGECAENPETGQSSCSADVIPEPGIILK
ncbi:MAG: hypothetical protein ABEI97_02200, partial [Candidatus Nanohaloarchaea archaeon]